MIEFFIAAVIVAIAPGPDNLFVLAQSATYGAKVGFSIILGLCTGILMQISLLAIGISALIVASPIAFFIMQCLGAGYLIFLAYKCFRVKVGTKIAQEKESEKLHLKSFYFKGIVMNLTNPKAILFLLSFIPPAVNLNRDISPTIQILILGLEFILSVIIVFGGVAVLAGTLQNFLTNSPKSNRNLNWFSGCVFILMAIALFFI